MVCTAAALQFRTLELPRAVFGVPYHASVETQVDGRCPIGDVVLELAGGRLPRGIGLSGDALTGIPKEFGVFRLHVRASNRCSSADEDLALEVTGKPILRASPKNWSSSAATAIRPKRRSFWWRRVGRTCPIRSA